MLPDLKELRSKMSKDPKVKSIETRAFTRRKDQILKCEAVLNSSNAPVEKHRDVVDAIMETFDKDKDNQSSGVVAKVTSALASFIPPALFGGSNPKLPDISNCSSVEFLRRLPEIVDKFPVLAEAANEAVSRAIEHFTGNIRKVVNRTAHLLEELQRDGCKRELKIKREYTWNSALDETRHEFLQAVSNTTVRDPTK